MTQTLKLFAAIEASTDWAKSQTLRNICYGTHQDNLYQDKVIADCTAEAKEILSNYNGSEVDDKNLHDLEIRTNRADDQKPEFQELHDLAVAAYKEVTGNDWVPSAKKPKTSRKAITASAEKWKARIAS